MPYCYCHQPSCESCDQPQLTSDPKTAKCAKCGKPLYATPLKPIVLSRVETLTPGVLKPAMVATWRVRHYYSQHPGQSGDTTGVGFALAIFPEMSHFFIIPNTEVKKSLGYLTFYQDMGVTTDRIVVVIADETVGSDDGEDGDEVEESEALKIEETTDGGTEELELLVNIQKLEEKGIKSGKSGERSIYRFVEVLRARGWPDVIAPKNLSISKLGALESMEWQTVTGERPLLSFLELATPYLGLFAVTETQGEHEPKWTALVFAHDDDEAWAGVAKANTNFVVKRCKTETIIPAAYDQSARVQRFETARKLLSLRMNRNNDRARKEQEGFERTVEARETLGKFSERIIPWTYYKKRGANQLYIDLVNLKLRTENVLGLRNAYQTVMRRDPHYYHEIGKTSRDILRLLQEKGLKEVTKRIAEPLSPGLKIVRAPMTKKFVDPMLERAGRFAGKRRVMLVLIWVRGLNAEEMEKVEGAGIGPDQVNEGNFIALDTRKRNPQHVTTAQLYQQLVSLFEFLNWRSDPQWAKLKSGRKPMREGIQYDRELVTGLGAWKSHYFVPVPIGDPVKIDQYDSAGGKNILVAAAVDNLIEYWTKNRISEVGGGHWRYLQLCAIRALLMDDRFDIMQLGIRSGATEQGMYQGMPGIFIEEEFSPTGSRMAQMTRGGPDQAEVDRQYQKALKTHGEDMRRPLSALRLEIARCTSLTELKKIAARTFTGPAKAEMARIAELHVQMAQRGPYDNKNGYPYFFRLITKHMIGLNQARTAEALAQFKADFEAFLYSGRLNFQERVMRGALATEEVGRLVDLLADICSGYATLRTNIFGLGEGEAVAEPVPLAPREIIGITNSLNQCYVNSVLQLCARLDVRTNYYRPGDCDDEDFAALISDFLANMQLEAQTGRYVSAGSAEGTDIVYTTQRTIEVRRGLQRKLSWGGIDAQEDAAEVLTAILGAFDTDHGIDVSPDGLRTVLNDEHFALLRSSQMSFILQVRTTYDLRIGATVNPAPANTWYRLTSGGSITRLEYHNHIQLSLDGTRRALAEVFDRNWKRQYGEDEVEGNDVICEGRYYLNAPRVAERITFHTAAPRHLIVQLKRFADPLHKIMSRVDGTAMFVLGGKIYALQGFIVHLGETMKGGHYIAFVRRDGHWFKVDDNKVTQDPRDVEDSAQQGYLFYYVANG